MTRRMKGILVSVITCALALTIACAPFSGFGEGLVLDLTAESSAATAIAPTWTPTATFTPTATPSPASQTIGAWPAKEAAVDVAIFSPALLAVADLNSLNIYRDDFWFDVESVMPTRIVFSPDGKTLLAGDATGLIYLLDANTGSEISRLPAHSSRVRDLAFSPDGAAFATAGDDGRITVWDAGGRDSLAAFSLTPGKKPAGVAWSQDGTRVLAVSASDGKGTLTVWDVGDENRLQEIAFESELTAIASAGGDSFLLGAADGSLYLWDMARDVLGYLKLPGGSPITAIRASGAGGAALLHEDGIAEIIWIAEGQTLHHIGSAAEPLTAISWSNGVILGVGPDQPPAVFTVDVSDPGGSLPAPTTYALDEIAPLYGLGYEAKALIFDAAGDLLAGSSGDQSIRWSLVGSTPGEAIASLYGPSFNLSAMAISPDGGLAASALQNGQIVITDIGGETVTVMATAEGQGGRATALLFTPDGSTLISGAEDGSVALWNAASGALVEALDSLGSPIIALGTSPEGDGIMAAAESGVIHLWSMKPGDVSLLDELRVDSPITAAVFAPGGDLVGVALEDGLRVQVIDTASGEVLREMPLMSEALALALAPDGLLAVCHQNQHLTLWQALRAEMHQDLRISSICRTVTFSPDGGLLAAGLSGGTVMAWEITP